MKQLLLLFLFILGNVSVSQAQSFVFLNAGVPVADNSTVSCGNLPEGFATSPITIQKTGDEEIRATLTISVLESSYGTGFVGYCGWGFSNCMPVLPGNALSSNRTVTNNNVINPDVEALATVAPFLFRVEYKLAYNGEEQKINVVLSSEHLTAIQTPDAGHAAFVSFQGDKAVLTYNFSSATERQMYICNLTGGKVAEIALTQNSGAVVLPDLPKGIYLYRIMENGKIAAANKYITK